MNIFQKRLTELMEHQSITQRLLAERIAVSESTISKYLNTDRIPHAEVIANMATALNTTTDYLLGRDESEEFNYLGFRRILTRNQKRLSLEEKRELAEILFGGHCSE